MAMPPKQEKKFMSEIIQKRLHRKRCSSEEIAKFPQIISNNMVTRGVLSCLVIVFKKLD
jgi:hypothetical protein